MEDVGWCFRLVLRKFSGKASFSSSEWFMVSFESDEPAMTLLIEPDLYWTPSDDTENDYDPATPGFWCAIEAAS